MFVVFDVVQRWHPFQLQPDLPPGMPWMDFARAKFGGGERLHEMQRHMRTVGAPEGIDFRFDLMPTAPNTFDAHRLLHWAGTLGRSQELALKQALLRAYFTDDLDVSSHEVLADAAATAGLDRDEALRVLGSDRHAADVRAREQLYQQRGISAVPSVIINDRHLIQGGQPVELFEQALRQIAAEGPATG